MPYEIDFIGIKKDDSSASKDADAICLRWRNTDGNYTVGVVDGGFDNHGNALVQHMNRYYFNDWNNCKTAKEKVVDFMVVTHPDQDHTIGLKQVLDNFTVKKIYMNIAYILLCLLFPIQLSYKVLLFVIVEFIISDIAFWIKGKRLALNVIAIDMHTETKDC